MKKSIQTMAICPHCRGTGKVSLSPVYDETLRILRRQRRPINGAGLAVLAKCPPNAMCNRLVVLERYGLVRGERAGRERLWTVN